MRGALGKSLQIRMIPRLRFHYDQVVVNGNRMAELIHQAVTEDEQNQQHVLENDTPNTTITTDENDVGA